MTPRDKIAIAILRKVQGQSDGINWYPLVQSLEGKIPPSPSVFEVLHALVDDGSLSRSDTTNSAKIAITAKGRVVLRRLGGI